MFLRILSNASGVSGYEGEVRDIVKAEIKDYVDEVIIDKMGNIIAHKRGKGSKVIIDVHMDEVGFIITGYNEDGTLRFNSLGGINNKIPPAKVVLIGKEKIPGVIGIKPIHLQSKEEKEKAMNYCDYCIDIGSKSKEETKRLVNLGDYAVFNTKFSQFGKNMIKGKAFDDRIGCAVLIEVLKEKYDCDIYGVFNVQEEVGERGAYISSFNIKPDIAIVLEGTICADMPNIPQHKRATEINKGPAISIMDKSSLFNNKISKEIIALARDKNIPYQLRRSVVGGNDGGAIHMSGEGAKVVTISVPCRYIHSAVSVASLDDYENTCKLVKEYLKTIV
ncbi:endoglucanase [Clostridium tetanomorphum]|uniref:M42 family metallopeptidase n=1 Tax=Clostridium tetanomorphum TaxID=1553 RepID=A0A923EF32_CLOTT|nr:M42 family metallopeptidase [Clostridium tetanomorphum]KAJ49471.1 Endoglucanase, aminopeptidase M42 family protein [Clostridium tetanomorphum DSM 665]KAJ53042.1 Endoglucanase, aminopeptidase M42 family protein [Clostridium tetanomorphum DSM 665]MBC2400175.1 M42 family metallopeptidase [Clostridium tetanomorphum]MBP1866573.1 endoglucanase [Clostridium tetanomorphum]NRS86686.1 endoglucanase [Clostridium tetanomorphum]